MLFDENKRILTAGKTEIRTVLVRDVRYFELNWPYSVSKPVSSFGIKAHTNIFSDENFMKVHGTQERFKEY